MLLRCHFVRRPAVCPSGLMLLAPYLVVHVQFWSSPDPLGPNRETLSKKYQYVSQRPNGSSMV